MVSVVSTGKCLLVGVTIIIWQVTIFCCVLTPPLVESNQLEKTNQLRMTSLHMVVELMFTGIYR